MSRWRDPPILSPSKGIRLSKWAVVVLNYNRAAETLRCIDSLDIAAGNVDGVDITLLVVDNGSNTETVDAIRSWAPNRPNCRFLYLNDNLGFARGMNTGIDHLGADSHDYFCLLNNDVTADPDAFAAMARHQRQYPSEVITGFVIKASVNGPIKAMGGWRYCSWLGIAWPNLKEALANQKATLDYVDGAGFFVSGDHLAKCGGIPENNFLYYEELNLAKTLSSRNDQGYSGEAVLYHVGAVTTSTELPGHKKHYFSMLACLRYTAETNRWMLPSVTLIRFAALIVRSLTERSLKPLTWGLKAFRTFCSEV